MNRTRDGRFLDKRVLMNKDILKDIILDVKQSNNFTIEGLSKILGVGSQMVGHDWLIEGRTIPLTKLKILLRKSKNFKFSDMKNDITLMDNLYWGQKLNKKEKKVIIPSINSKDFCEFYGIMLGDGCITSDMKSFVITGDKILEKPYYEDYLFKLISKLFGFPPKIIYSKDSRVARSIFYSKKICSFLASIGFPVGLKSKGNMSFPKFIKTSNENLASCIRGIMDTDGSLSSHPNVKIMIHFSITNKALRKSVLNGLNTLGIRGGEFNKGIMIYGSDKLNQFHKEIGFSNYKNIVKYNHFKTNGRVPSSREVETFIRAKKSL
jgi:hypothetical protein